jgi:hypothetical protein
MWIRVLKRLSPVITFEVNKMSKFQFKDSAYV